jgi:hypothetical protein
MLLFRAILGSAVCEKAFKAIETAKPHNGGQAGSQHINFRPQAIFLLALGFVFVGFVLIALLRCCCVLVCRSRGSGCCKSQACKSTPAAPANAEEMQTLVYEEPAAAAAAPVNQFPAGGFIYVAPAGTGAGMTPQFVQMAYPGQPLYY